ncbi:hypothetical protein DHODJN_11975 [Methylorubrum extorquens]
MADYARPETLAEAFRGIDRLLLISSSEIGQRVAQHQNVIQAARQSGVSLIAYTSRFTLIPRHSPWRTSIGGRKTR